MDEKKKGIEKTKKFLKWTLIYYGVLIFLALAGAFYFAVFQGEELKREFLLLKKRIPPEVDVCFTDAVPSALPKGAKFLDSFYIPENGKVEEIKIYRFGKDYYAVFPRGVYKAGHPKGCEIYFQSAGVKRSP